MINLPTEITMIKKKNDFPSLSYNILTALELNELKILNQTESLTRSRSSTITEMNHGRQCDRNMTGYLIQHF